MSPPDFLAPPGDPPVCSELWLRWVYSYFHGSYSPDGTDRTHAVMQHDDMLPVLPPEYHLGFLYVRSHFPQHEPREDLIADPGKGWGEWPCSKCSQPVHYAALHDAWCAGTWRHPAPACPQGGQHEVGQ